VKLLQDYYYLTAFPVVQSNKFLEQNLKLAGEKRKKSHHCPCQKLNSGHLACSLVSIITELPQLLSLSVLKVGQT
jgi:hypothetical protein